jgi:hypothetical protein
MESLTQTSEIQIQSTVVSRGQGLSRRSALTIVGVSFVVSRLVYLALGVRFDAEPLTFYWQYIDPELLRTEFWRSLFYLEQQPPGFNFFLGAVLNIFGRYSNAAFQAIYLILGLAMALALFELMDLMGADRRIALGIALVFALNPSTILYENLLFYEYPLAVLFCIAGLFLYRFASSGRMRYGLAFFSALAMLSVIRSIFHLFWYCLIVFSLAWALRRWRRRVLMAAVLPGLLPLFAYTKHFAVFHSLIPGGNVYLGINWSTMMTYPLPEQSVEAMIASKNITPLLRTSIFHLYQEVDQGPANSSIASIIPVPVKTGIRIRDECRKSTGAINWNCTWARDVSRAYLRDSLVVFRSYPGAYLTSLAWNVLNCFDSDTGSWPFDGRRHNEPNQEILARPLAIYNLLRTGEWPPYFAQPWLAYIVLPMLLGLGCWRSHRLAKRHDSTHRARYITLTFMVSNILFLLLVTVVLSEADQNRYRTEVSTYFAVLLALLLTEIYSRSRRDD